MSTQKRASRADLRVVGLPILILFALVMGACSGGGGDDDATTPVTGSSSEFTIWVPQTLKQTMDRTIRHFQNAFPDTDVEVVYGTAPELNDRLLQGERPDLYVGSGRQLEPIIDEGTLPEDTVEFGVDVMQLVVPPGNPKQVADLQVFGVDPLTNTGLCKVEIGCGKSATSLLLDAGVTPAPDFEAPDAATLIDQIASGALDAGLLFRTEIAKAVREGRVDAIDLPSQNNAEVRYKIAINFRGQAVDEFLQYIDRSSSVQNQLQLSGLAPPAGA